MSRVGKKSITLPDKVTVKVNGSSVQVEGPKGKLSWTLPEGITASVEGNQLSCASSSVPAPSSVKSMHPSDNCFFNSKRIAALSVPG